jgi:hypothetical protein
MHRHIGPDPRLKPTGADIGCQAVKSRRKLLIRGDPCVRPPSELLVAIVNLKIIKAIWEHCLSNRVRSLPYILLSDISLVCEP